MADELLDRLVGQGYRDDVETIIRSRTELRELVKVIVSANDSAKNAEGLSLQAKTILDVVNAQKQMIDSHAKLGEASRKFTEEHAKHLKLEADVRLKLAKASEAEARARAANAKASELEARARAANASAIQKENQALATGEAIRTQVAKTVTEQARAAKESAKATLDEAKATTEAVRQKKLEQEYTQRLTREIERLEAARDRELRKLEQQNTAYGTLKARHKEAADLAKELGSQYVLLEEQLEKLQAQQSKGGGIPGQNLSGQIAIKAGELNKLSIAVGAANADALRLHSSLLKVEQAVGQSQRNVGNYTSAIFSLTQVLREAPAFANSFATGLSALGNNLPILIEEFKKVRIATGSTAAAFRVFGGALFSLNGILPIAYLALQLLFTAFAASGKESKKAAGELSYFNKQQKEAADLAKKVGDNYGKEAAALEIMKAKIEDVNLPMSVRLDTIAELQKKFPDYFGNLQQEAILIGNVGDAYAKANESIMARARVNAYGDALEKNAARMNVIKDRIDATARRSTTYGITQSGPSSKLMPGAYDFDENKITSGRIADPKYPTGEFDEEKNPIYSSLRQDIGEYNGLLYRNIDLLDRVRQANRAAVVDSGPTPGSVAALRKQIADLKAKIELQQIDSDARKASTKQLIELEKQLREIEGKGTKERTKKPPDLTNELIKAETDLTEERYEVLKRRAEIESDIQQDTATNERNSLNERLEASRAFGREQLRIVNLDYTAEVKVLQQRLDKIAEFEKIPVAKQTGEQKGQIREKKILQEQLLTAEAGYQRKVNKIVSDGEEERLEMEEKDQAQRAEAVLAGLKKIEALYTEGYARQKDGLDGQLKKGRISLQQYNRELNKLNNENAKQVFTAQVENLEDLIELFPKGSEEASKLNEQLAELKKQLAEIKANAPKTFSFGLDEDQIQRVERFASQAQSLFSSLGDLSQALSQQRIQAIDKEIAAIEKKRDAEVSAIEAAGYSDEVKRRKIAEAEAKADAQSKQLEEQKNQRARRAAMIQKGITIAQIISETALATVRALGSLPYTPANIALAAGTAAAGAAQLAVAIAAPLPSYRFGTKDHPGGDAIMAEGNKRELVREKSGRWGLALKEGRYALEKHAQVFPHDQTEKMLRSAMFQSFHIPYPMAWEGGSQQLLDVTPLMDKLDDVKDAVRSAPRTSVRITGKGIQHLVHAGNSSSTYEKNL